ncbi:mucin-2-like isoform X2 [Topomyia yanbarensis]|uniref:mucin-2-like isoform X2 n=1 Tax=Topomyia yanbarensis TaxID=2498891 RepID=UPI00273AE8FC|nr:mucin-2-like isoform X2 [Topomyia yanbarensis]
MRNVWIVVASALLAFANFVKSQETSRNLYSSRYDNLDIDTILSSNRLVNNYVDCLLSRKPCPPEGKDLKRILPEALRTKCGRCSATQKENAIKIITTLYNNYPVQYQALRERWDPSGEYHRRLEEYIRGLQFNQIGSNGGNGVSPPDRPVRNDFDRDQSQILLQTLLLSSTTVAPTVPSPNAIPSGPEQRPQLAQTQITQPVALVSITSTTTTTTSTTSTAATPPPTTILTPTTTTTTSTTTTLPTTTTGSGTTSSSSNSNSSSSNSSNNDGNPVESSTAAATTATSSTLVDSPAVDTLPSTVFNPQALQSSQQQQIASNINTLTQALPSQAVAASGSQNFQSIISSDPSMNQNLFLQSGPTTTTAALASRPDTPATTARTTTNPRLILRPVAAGLNFNTDTLPTAGTVSNRFGDDDDNGDGNSVPMSSVRPTAPNPITARPQPQSTTKPVVRQTTSRMVTQRTTTRFGGGPANPNGSPFVGLFNQLGTKLATTADAIAGMLRKTVDVIVSSHLQAHQRALRSYN